MKKKSSNKKACRLCVIGKVSCSSACPTKEVSEAAGLAESDLRPLTNYFSNAFVKARFAAGILHLKTKTEAKIVFLDQLMEVKHTLNWEHRLWLSKPTEGAMSEYLKFLKAEFQSMPLSEAASDVDPQNLPLLDFNPEEMSMSMLDESFPTESGAELKFTSEDMEMLDESFPTESGADVSVEFTPEEMAILDDCLQTKSGADQHARNVALRNKNFAYLLLKSKLNEGFFPREKLNALLIPAEGDVEVQNRILASLIWECKAWVDHPLKGPRALCEVTTSSSLEDHPSKDQADLTCTRGHLLDSARKLDDCTGRLDRMETLLAKLETFP